MKEESTQPRPVLIIVMSIFIAVLLFIPMRVMSYGYMPRDDALRHAAKAVSGKSWDEILVLRPEITMDSHIGWHTILEFIYKTTGCSVDNLVLFSIVSLFILFCLVPIFFLKRPEAWLVALLIITVANFFSLSRIFVGRPFVFTMAVVVFLGFAWSRFKTKPIPWPSVIILTILISMATWIHCLWYMLALPVVCFFIAREWRAGFVVFLCVISGVVIGMLMTGHPVQFFLQTLGHFFHSLRGGHTFTWQLVPEFRPFDGDNMVVIAVLGLLCWRGLRNDWDPKVIYTPIFILVVSSWILGFLVMRVWTDWGIPAVCVWMALEIEKYLKTAMASSSWKRVGLTLMAACVLYVSITSNHNDRWTESLSVQYLSADNPEHRKWLPGKGGIIYNTNMPVFYQTFYANPHGDWRYILGFEQSMMPSEDLAIFRKIQLTSHSAQALGLWVKKMRPEDRMILQMWPKPTLRELEWNRTVSGIWVGRLPGKQKVVQ